MLYIIRHGQTEMNSRRLLQGRSDIPLNSQGIAQAEEAALLLRSKGICFDHVFSSPLARAVQTAAILADGTPVHTDPRLIEMDYGPYEGADLRDPAPELRHFFEDFIRNPAPAGMEPLQEVVARTGQFLEELRLLKGNVLISTHAVSMKGILEYLSPDSHGSYWSKYIANCEIYCCEQSEAGFTVPFSLGTGLPVTPGV
ncbi:MAG: histidine phosphatase family protein [Oscillospiraceae bacterium]|nr:histidine phosphatase family protein [Oscillospiraceae bacterium]